MADTSVPPAASEITLSAIQYILTLYATTVEAFYKTKLKDAKKYSVALETDTWRYEEFPKEIARRKTKNTGGLSLDLAELEKLVEWKITHGKFRPFLLPQIRKNSTQQVKEACSESWRLLPGPSTGVDTVDSGHTPSNDTLKKALDAACVLKGVGPATGTLLLSIFSPDSVPFFQDELYAWLASDGSNTDVAKLKYNVKEYLELVDGVKLVRARLGGKLKAWEIEKVGFVVGHWDLIGQKERQTIWSRVAAVGDAGEGHDSGDGATKKRKVNQHSEDATHAVKKRKTLVSNKGDSKKIPEAASERKSPLTLNGTGADSTVSRRSTRNNT